MKWKDIRKKVKTVEGKNPQSEHAVKNAVERVEKTPGRGVPITNYKNSGRRYGADGVKRACMQKRWKIRPWSFETFPGAIWNPPKSSPERAKMHQNRPSAATKRHKSQNICLRSARERTNEPT